MLNKSGQNSTNRQQEASLQPLEANKMRSNQKGNQFVSKQHQHLENQNSFQSQSNSKNYHFEHIETCSHSELSLIDQQPRVVRHQSHLIHLKADKNIDRINQETGVPIQVQSERQKAKMKQGSFKILRINSNSMQMRINQHQIQQLHTNDRNLYPTQKTIIISSFAKSSDNNSNIQSTINTFSTVKNLNNINPLQVDREQEFASIKRYYLEDMNTKHNLQDLDNKSSCSSEHQYQINEIWEKSCYEVNEIEGIIEKEAYSSSESQRELQKGAVCLQFLRQENKRLVEINDQLSRENQVLKNQLQSANAKIHIYLQKNQEIKILNDFNSQKYEELELENKQLNDLILDYKREAYNHQLILKQLYSKLALIEPELAQTKKKIEHKEEQITCLKHSLEDKNAEIEDFIIVNTELEEFIMAKKSEYEDQVKELQREIGQLKEAIDCYKERLQQEGFTFNLEEIKRIKEIFEFQADQDQQTVTSLQKSYQQQLTKLQQQNRFYASQLSNFKQKQTQSTTKHYKIHFDLLQSQTQDLIVVYDEQLEARDEEILALKQQLLEQGQFITQININACKKYIEKVDSLTHVILSQKIDRYNSAELIMEFLYVVDKVCRMFIMVSKQNEALRRQNSKWSEIVKKKDRISKQEAENTREAYNKLQTQAYLLKQVNAELVQSIKTLRKRQKLQLRQPNRAVNVSLGISNNLQMENIYQRKGIYKADRIIQAAELESVTAFCTLQQVLFQNNLDQVQKIQLTLALLSLAKGILQDNRKLVSLKPKKLKVISSAGKIRLELSQTRPKRGDESQKQLIYCAPEVLLGFSESELSYVWTIGLIIDCLFHCSLFYKKINEVTSRADNYYCRDEGLGLKKLLESMMKKKQKERCTLQQAQGIIKAYV